MSGSSSTLAPGSYARYVRAKAILGDFPAEEGRPSLWDRYQGVKSKMTLADPAADADAKGEAMTITLDRQRRQSEVIDFASKAIASQATDGKQLADRVYSLMGETGGKWSEVVDRLRHEGWDTGLISPDTILSVEERARATAEAGDKAGAELATRIKSGLASLQHSKMNEEVGAGGYAYDPRFDPITADRSSPLGIKGAAYATPGAPSAEYKDPALRQTLGDSLTGIKAGQVPFAGQAWEFVTKGVPAILAARRVKSGEATANDIATLNEYQAGLIREAITPRTTLNKVGEFVKDSAAFGLELAAGGLTSAPQQAAKKFVRDRAEKSIAKTVVGGAVTGALSLPAQAGRVSNAAADRMIQDDEGAASAVTKAVLDTYIENITERAGAGLKLLPGAKYASRARLNLMNRLGIDPMSKGAKVIDGIAKAGGYNGPVGEIGEEYLGALLRGATGLTDGVKNPIPLDDLPAFIISTMVPGGASLLAKGAVSGVDALRGKEAAPATNAGASGEAALPVNEQLLRHTTQDGVQNAPSEPGVDPVGLDPAQTGGGAPDQGGDMAGGAGVAQPAVAQAAGDGVAQPEDVRPVEDRVPPVVGNEGMEAGGQPGDVGGVTPPPSEPAQAQLDTAPERAEEPKPAPAPARDPETMKNSELRAELLELVDLENPESVREMKRKPLIAAVREARGMAVEPGEATTKPERVETIESQLTELRGGTRPAVLITPGAKGPTVPPKGMKALRTKAGRFIYDPAKLSPAEIMEAVRGNRIGEVLGYGIANKPAPGTEVGVVTVRGADGVEKRAVVTDAANLESVMREAEKAAGPGDRVSIEQPGAVLRDRGQASEKKGSGAADRLIAKADEWEKKARERMQKRVIPRGRNIGSSTLIEDSIDAGIIVAARIVKTGAKSARGLKRAVDAMVKEQPELAKHRKTITRTARRIIDDSKNADGVMDESSFDRAAASIDRRATEEKVSVKRRVQEATGVRKTEEKTLTGSEALARSLKREEKSNRVAFREGVASVRPKLEALEARVQDVKKRGLAAKLKGEQAVGKLAYDAATKEQRGIRDQVVRMIRAELPKEIHGKFLGEVRDATTMEDIAGVIAKMRAVLDRHGKDVERRDAKAERERFAQLDAVEKKVNSVKLQAMKGRLAGEAAAHRDAYRMATKEQREIRAEVTRLIRENLPPALHGRFLTNVRDARGIEQIAKAVGKARKLYNEHDYRDVRNGLDRAIKRANPKHMLEEFREVVEEAQKILRTAKEQAEKVSISPSGIKTRTLVEDQAVLTAHADILRQARLRVLEARAQQKLANEIKIRNQVSLRSEIVRRAVTDIEKRPGIRSTDKLEHATSATIAGKARIALWNADTIGEAMGNEQLHRLLTDELWDGETMVFRDTREGMDALQAVVEAHGYKWGSDGLRKLSEPTAGRRGVEAKEIKLESGQTLTASPAELMALYATLTDRDAGRNIRNGAPIVWARNKLGSPLKLTELDAASIEKAIDPKHRAIVDALKKHVETKVRPGVFKAFREQKGYDLQEVPGYWRTRRSLTPTADSGLITPVVKYMNQALEELGFLKERSPDTKKPYVIGDVFEDYHDMVYQGAVVSHMTRRVRQLEYLFQTQELRQAIQSRFGRQMLDRIESHINAGKMIFVEPSSSIEKVASFLSKQTARSMLTLNPGTMAKQLGGVFKLGAVMDAADLARGVKDAGSERVGDLLRESAYFQNRYDESIWRRMSPSHRARSPLLGQSSTAELFKGVRVGELVDKIGLLNKFDAVVARTAIAGKIAEAERKHPQWTAKQVNEYAVQEAEYAIRRTQNSHSPLDMSGLAIRERGRLGSALLMFTSDSNKSFNILASAIRSGDKKRIGSAFTAVVLNNAWASAVSTVLGQEFLSAVLGGGDDDEKNTGTIAGRFAREFVKNTAGMLYFGDSVSDVGDKFVRASMGQNVRTDSGLDMPGSQGIEEIYSSILNIAKATQGGAVASGPNKGHSRRSVYLERAAIDALEGSSTLTGVPILPIWSIGKRVDRAINE